MASLVATALKMAGGNDRFDDTITDRINHVTTTAILVVMSSLVTTTNLVGTPIECWVPKEFKKTHVEYINNVCWIKGMYNTSFDTEFIPSARGSGRKATILYYPWVPLILLGMAFFYSIPCMVWRSFQAKSGFDVSNLVEYGFKVSSPKVKNDVRGSLLDHMTLQFKRYLNYSKNANLFSSKPHGHHPYETKWTISPKHIFSKTCFSRFGHKHLNYLSSLQISVKFLYVLNSIGLMFLLDIVLGVNFHRYGAEVLVSLVKWNLFTVEKRNKYTKFWWEWSDLSKVLNYHQEIRFPKVTMCDFKERKIGRVINHTVQCALPTNLFNEKIFLILWFWMVLVAVLNIFSLIRWTLRNVIGKDRYHYVKNLLLLSGLISPKSRRARMAASRELEALNVSFHSENSDSNINNNNNINNENMGSQRLNNSIPNNRQPLIRFINNSTNNNNSNNSNNNNIGNETIVTTILTQQQQQNDERKLLVMFSEKYLGKDGVLLLHILNQATNTIVAVEMVEKLWIDFREMYEYQIHQQDQNLEQKRKLMQRIGNR